MKTLFKTLLVVIIGSVMTSCVATASTYPIHTNAVAKVHKPKVIVYKNQSYYRNAGVWYVKKKRGYVPVAAPIGIRVTTLPAGCKVIKVRGVRYYKHNGVFYKKSGRRYIVVNV